ncbi:hypothetical protein SpCBS45565_g02022 [Spizellomyces sp. 'palustris']|nr:hypothetical protein SpCBS45565_g02022 [Spizellomyces sp. 'palustris']
MDAELAVAAEIMEMDEPTIEILENRVPDLGRDPYDSFSEDERDQEDITKNITKDGGVTKRILRAGKGLKMPEKGDEVYVTYIGRLVPGGQIFDQNVDEVAPFKFTLGSGMVIPGWEEGIPTMKEGEHAILTIKPEYGYGGVGLPPKIPANATLEFKVQVWSWKPSNALTKDGKVILKKTKQDEKGWHAPKDDWEVIVNLKGIITDSETTFVERDDFAFTLGKETDPIFPPGCLISKAIQRFKRRDQGFLVVPPEHAYGRYGNASLGIPPFATLRYELELLRWHQVDKIGDTPVLKKILVEGTGWEKPHVGTVVEVRATGRCVQCGKHFLQIPSSDSSTRQESHFVLCSGALPEAVELAVEHMRVGEKALVTAPANFGYGESLARQVDIPQQDDLEFEIELVSFERTSEMWDMSHDERFVEMQRLREMGNKLFKDGKPRLARKNYERAVKFFQHEYTLDPEYQARVNLVLLPCYLNLAACYLKAQEWTRAIHYASKALNIDRGNVKALYRRAQGYLGRVDYELAKKDCDSALEHADETVEKELVILLKHVQMRMKETDAKQKKLFAKMLSGVVSA